MRDLVAMQIDQARKNVSASSKNVARLSEVTFICFVLERGFQASILQITEPLCP